MPRRKYSDSRTVLEEQLRALEALEQYPIKPSWVGSACQPLVDADPLFGITDRLADVVESDDGTFSCELPVALVSKHEGKSARVGNKDVIVSLEIAEVVERGVPDGSIHKRS